MAVHFLSWDKDFYNKWKSGPIITFQTTTWDVYHHECTMLNLFYSLLGPLTSSDLFLQIKCAPFNTSGLFLLFRVQTGSTQRSRQQTKSRRHLFGRDRYTVRQLDSALFKNAVLNSMVTNTYGHTRQTTLEETLTRKGHNVGTPERRCTCNKRK